MTIFTTDLGLPEAPLLLADGSWLVAELAFERGRITKVSADGSTHETIAETGRPNGLALGRDGIVWACETLTPSLLRMQPSGAYDVVVTEVEGVPLLWPNDLCFGPDGALYVTDSGLLVRDFLDAKGAPVPGCESLPMKGIVFRYDLATGESRHPRRRLPVHERHRLRPGRAPVRQRDDHGRRLPLQRSATAAASGRASCSATFSTRLTRGRGCAGPTAWRSPRTDGCS